MIDYREEISHGNAGFPLAVYHITPAHIRYQMVFHWHPEHEICYIIKGKLRLTLDNESYDAAEGDIFFIQGGTLHSGVATEDCEYDCFVFDLNRMVPDGYTGKDFCSNLSENTVRVINYLGNRPEPFYSLCRKLSQLDGDGEGAGKVFGMTGLILEFMGRISDGKLFKSVSQPTEHTVKSLSAMRNVLYKIEQEYMKPLTLEELADTANLSPNYFCRFFKNLTSRSPIDYLIAYRVDMGEYLLRTTDRPITDIALACGFNDVSHFIKYFRREKGITPKRYRTSQMLNEYK